MMYNLLLMLLYAPMLLFSTHWSQAQTLYVGEDQLLAVGEDALLSVQGNLENNGELTHQGEINLAGDWLNQGLYTSSRGLLRLSGNADQVINHAEASFDQVIVASTGDILLDSRLVIIRQLNLVQGIVRGELSRGVFLEETAEITGGSEDTYVDGPISAAGTGYRYFPVGTHRAFLPLELLNVSGTRPVLRVQVDGPHPAPRQLDDLESVSRQHYWQVDLLTGSYEGSVVRLSIVEETDFSDLTGLVVAAGESLEGEYTSLGRAEISGTVVNGSITSEEPAYTDILVIGRSDEFSVANQVLVPNAFAPDAAIEENRTLTIAATNLTDEQFVFRIFNRWGQIVYETGSLVEAMNNGWNGVNQETNEPAQFGVYTYYLSGRLSNGESLSQKGTLTLFR